MINKASAIKYAAGFLSRSVKYGVKATAVNRAKAIKTLAIKTVLQGGARKGLKAEAKSLQGLLRLHRKVSPAVRMKSSIFTGQYKRTKKLVYAGHRAGLKEGAAVTAIALGSHPVKHKAQTKYKSLKAKYGPVLQARLKGSR